MSRRSVKAALKARLITVPGVKSAWEAMPIEIPATMQPTLVIHLPSDNEDKVTSNGGHGRRKVTYVCRLELGLIDANRDPVASELAFEDLVDGVKKSIRETPQLIDGSEWPIAGLNYIKSKIIEPRQAGKDNGAVIRAATIEFDIVEFVEG